MPDPKTLKVGDRVRFVCLPEEWSRPGIGIHRDSVAFMKAMIRRSYPSRIYKIDKCGLPWIQSRIWKRGRWESHYWSISDSTGWRKVKRRKR
jgi:hypothetical protein